MAKGQSEVIISVHRLETKPHQAKPYRARFGKSSVNFWASLFDVKKHAETIVSIVKQTKCGTGRRGCPVAGECSKPMVIERKRHHLRFTAEASSIHNIFTPTSGARCMRKRQ